MAFSEDKIPACRCTAHPSGEDKRKWMKVVKTTDDHVVWCCTRCTEIAKVPTIQVFVLPKGKEKAQYLAAAERNKTRDLFKKYGKVGRVAVTEEK